MSTAIDYSIAHERHFSASIPIGLSVRTTSEPGIRLTLVNRDSRTKLVGLALLLSEGGTVCPRLSGPDPHRVYGVLEPGVSSTLDFAFDRLRALKPFSVAADRIGGREIDGGELLVLDTDAEDGSPGSIELIAVEPLMPADVVPADIVPSRSRDAVTAEAVAAYMELDSAARDEMKSAYRELYWRAIERDPEYARRCASIHSALVNAWSRTAPLVTRILGTQSIGSKYQFTPEPALLEQAKRVLHEMGSDVFKFSIGRWGVATMDTEPVSLVDAVRSNPTYREVLDLPFRNIMMWAYPTSTGTWFDWNRPMTFPEIESTYREIRDLAEHLLTEYRNTGKTFFLGNWEGDWHYYDLKGGTQFREPPAVRARVMREWLALRQRAVDDARSAVGEHGVRIFHYAEINHPVRGMVGRASVITDVIPYVDVDFVSYSSYDSTGSAPAEGDTAEFEAAVGEVLEFIEDRLPPRDIPGRRVFIGEYGFPVNGFNDPGLGIDPEVQAHKTRATIRAGLRYGCPFILYWELYCNEVRPDGTHNGFWLIDPDNVPQPAYVTHQRYLAAAAEFECSFADAHGRPPTAAELTMAGEAWTALNE